MSYEDLVLMRASVLPLSEERDSLDRLSTTQLLAIRIVSMTLCSYCLA